MNYTWLDGQPLYEFYNVKINHSAVVSYAVRPLNLLNLIAQYFY